MRATNIKLVLFSHEMWGTKEKNVPRRILISKHVFLVARPIDETKEISNRRMLKTCWLSVEKISVAKGNVRNRQRPFQVVKLIAISGCAGFSEVSMGRLRFQGFHPTEKQFPTMPKLGRSGRTPARWFKQFHFLPINPLANIVIENPSQTLSPAQAYSTWDSPITHSFIFPFLVSLQFNFFFVSSFFAFNVA